MGALVAMLVVAGFFLVIAFMFFSNGWVKMGVFSLLFVALFAALAPHEYSVALQRAAAAKIRAADMAKQEAEKIHEEAVAAAAAAAAKAAAANPICVLIVQVAGDEQAAGAAAAKGQINIVKAEGAAIQQAQQATKVAIAADPSYKVSTCTALQQLEATKSQSGGHSGSSLASVFGDVVNFLSSLFGGGGGDG
jgi:hypothetical protein